MQVKIENGKLLQAMSLLFNLPLKGKQSRHRTKLIKLLEARSKEVEEQRIELAKEHSNKDEDGNPKSSDGKYDIKNMEAFKKDLQELYEEELVIEGGDNHGMLKTVKQILFNCEQEFKGIDATIYDYLCDQFEGVEDK
ncbi:hypothetical protein BC6307_17885 [Sutcliffiella cohnii]|uniref:DUF1617 family protein n=1 Tax=Sutcliffiella cohnii TaxID=33932 RepID=A0A223KUJ5_9BACI|nr:DUF1617 family protein [Sutcliffiella cohnii]AST92998.1 hypothetical protein BC6307_17885 [Sutcliffiella cohnii]